MIVPCQYDSRLDLLMRHGTGRSCLFQHGSAHYCSYSSIFGLLLAVSINTNWVGEMTYNTPTCEPLDETIVLPLDDTL